MAAGLKKSREGRRDIPALTGVRAIAAAWVLLYHYAFLAQRFLSPAQIKLLLPFSTGFLGVDLFFILSGFILGYNYVKKFRQFHWPTFADFMAARLSRIYPVHLFTLLVLLLLVGVSKLTHSHMTQGGSFLPSSFLRNLFLVQGWSLPVHLTWNGPSWSLSEEWLAYLAFPLLIGFITIALKSVRLQILALLALPVVLTIVCTHQQRAENAEYGLLRICFAFPVGVLLSFLYDRRPPLLDKIARPGILWFAAAMALSVVSNQFHISPYWVEIFLAMFLYSLALENSFGEKVLTTPGFVYAGKVSFAVYMCQWIFLLPGNKTLSAKAVQFGWAGIGVYWLALTVGIIVFAIFTFHCVEEPARKRIRQPIARFLRRLGPVASKQPVA